MSSRLASSEDICRRCFRPCTRIPIVVATGRQIILMKTSRRTSIKIDRHSDVYVVWAGSSTKSIRFCRVRTRTTILDEIRLTVRDFRLPTQLVFNRFSVRPQYDFIPRNTTVLNGIKLNNCFLNAGRTNKRRTK